MMEDGVTCLSLTSSCLEKGKPSKYPQDSPQGASDTDGESGPFSCIIWKTMYFWTFKLLVLHRILQ